MDRGHGGPYPSQNILSSASELVSEHALSQEALYLPARGGTRGTFGFVRTPLLRDTTILAVLGTTECTLVTALAIPKSKRTPAGHHKNKLKRAAARRC